MEAVLSSGRPPADLRGDDPSMDRRPLAGREQAG